MTIYFKNCPKKVKEALSKEKSKMEIDLPVFCKYGLYLYTFWDYDLPIEKEHL